MSVEKRNGKYVVRWRDSAGKQRSKTVQLWRDAVALDGEMKRKKAMGELITHERGRETLEDFWTLWWQRYARVHLTPRTQDVYKRLWGKHVEPVLGRYRLRDISPEHVAEFTSRLTGTLAPSSVRKCLAILQGVLQRAVEWQYIGSNPAQGVRKPRLVSRRGRALDHEQLAALFKELDPRSCAIVSVLSATGLRPGELRALHWENVGEDYVDVRYAVSRNEIGPTKTYKARRVPLRGPVLDVMKRWRFAQGPLPPSSFVFPSVDGQGVWTDTAWNIWAKRVFAPAARRAGLTGLVPYDLRHTYVTALIRTGHNPIDVARWSGHSLVVCLSTYAHEFESTSPSSSPARSHAETPDLAQPSEM